MMYNIVVGLDMNGVKTERDILSEEDEDLQLNDSQFLDLMQQLENYTPTVSFCCDNSLE